MLVAQLEVIERDLQIEMAGLTGTEVQGAQVERVGTRRHLGVEGRRWWAR